MLRAHAGSGSTTNDSFGGSSVRTASGEGDFPSFMIRASSFDGKPVYVKKKSLADRARKVRVTQKLSSSVFIHRFYFIYFWCVCMCLFRGL